MFTQAYHDYKLTAAKKIQTLSEYSDHSKVLRRIQRPGQKTWISRIHHCVHG